MERRSCSPGSQWDSLLKFCIPLDRPESSPSAPAPALAPDGPGAPWRWWSVCVGLMASLSLVLLLLLLVWIFIYRRRRSRNCSLSGSGENVSKPHTLKTIEPGADTQSPWQRFKRTELPSGRIQSHRLDQWNVGCLEGGRGYFKGQRLSDGWETGRSLGHGWDLYNDGSEHGLPLPATELGDSTLVTTKTGQLSDV